MIRFDFNLECPYQPRSKCIAAEIGSAIIGGLGKLFGAGASAASQAETNRTNLQIARETNEQNYKMFQEQLGFTEDMWNMQNAYNDPSQQMERFRNAGINPYMAMGVMNGGNAEAVSTPSPNPAITGAPMQSVLSGIGDVSGAVSDTIDDVGKLIDLETRSEKNKAEISKAWKEGHFSDAAAENQFAQANRIDFLLGPEKELMLEQIGLAKAQAAESLEHKQLISLQRNLAAFDFMFTKPAELRRINAEINALAEDVASRRISARSAMMQANTLAARYHMDEETAQYLRSEIQSRTNENIFLAPYKAYNLESSGFGAVRGFDIWNDYNRGRFDDIHSNYQGSFLSPRGGRIIKRKK